MKFSFAALMAGLTLTLSVALSAQQVPPPTPTSAKGVEVISVDQAKALLGKATFFDMRSAVSFGKGHLKGATALPYDNKSDNTENFDAAADRFDMAKLPTDKATVIVFYSDGPTGWKSYKAAVQAARKGYKDVRWMREGTAGWTAKGLPLE